MALGISGYMSIERPGSTQKATVPSKHGATVYGKNCSLGALWGVYLALRAQGFVPLGTISRRECNVKPAVQFQRQYAARALFVDAELCEKGGDCAGIRDQRVVRNPLEEKGEGGL